MQVEIQVKVAHFCKETSTTKGTEAILQVIFHKFIPLLKLEVRKREKLRQQATMQEILEVIKFHFCMQLQQYS